MPWCPKCRNEYVEGITVCADCGVDLVDELPEETDENMPSILCRVKDEGVGSKFILYLNMQGIQTAGLMPVSQDPEEDEEGFYLVVAGFEREAAESLFEGFAELEELSEEHLRELAPELEEKFEEMQEEEANQMFSELRTESSTVYVKKKDKYSDLKFSGISFIVFGVLGCILLTLNALEYVNLFNGFSSLIMTAVFIIFFAVGISSLLRARKMKGLVSQEETISDDVLNWVDEHITDDYIRTLIDPEQTEEDNYFNAHNAMCERVSEQFPLFNPAYIDQMMDDRYNEYCESEEAGVENTKSENTEESLEENSEKISEDTEEA